MSYAVPENIARNVIALADEGRIIQGAWRTQSDGKEYVCALAAFGSNIQSASDCPAEYMPRWLSELVPALDDGIANSEVRWFARGLGERALVWSNLDDGAWERVRIGFVKTCITQALETAERVQPTPRPAYWDQVQNACAQVLRALDGDGDLARAALAAAWAAAAAWAEAAAPARVARRR